MTVLHRVMTIVKIPNCHGVLVQCYVKWGPLVWSFEVHILPSTRIRFVHMMPIFGLFHVIYFMTCILFRSFCKWRLISWWLLTYVPTSQGLHTLTHSYHVWENLFYLDLGLECTVLVLREAYFAGSIVSHFFRGVSLMRVWCIGILLSLPLFLSSVLCPLIIGEHRPSYFHITFTSPLRWLFYIRLISSLSFNSFNILQLMKPSPFILVRRSYHFYENGGFTLLLRYDTSAEVIRCGKLEWRQISGIRILPLQVGTRLSKACDILVFFYNSPA